MKVNRRKPLVSEENVAMVMINASIMAFCKVYHPCNVITMLSHCYPANSFNRRLLWELARYLSTPTSERQFEFVYREERKKK